MKIHTDADEMNSMQAIIYDTGAEEGGYDLAPPPQQGGRDLAPPPQQGGLRRVVSKAPAFPRFKDKAQRRAGGNIIKFLAALLALTLIARGTSGATLARVEVSAPSRNEIIEAVSGSATVSVRDSLDISAPEGLTIVEMLVGAGQTVSNGDAIAVFDMSEVQTKLSRESAALEKMLLDMDKLDRIESSDSTSLENSLRNLRRAQDDYKATSTQGENDISAASDALDEIWNKLLDDPDAAALENALRNLSRVQEDYDSVEAQGESDVAAARTALREARSSQADSVDSTAVVNTRRSYNRELEDFAAVEARIKAAIAPEQEALNAAKAYESEMKTAFDNAEEDDKDEAEKAYLAAVAETKKAQETFDAAKKKAESDFGLLTAKRRLEDAESAYLQARDNYSNNSEKASSARQDAIDKAQSSLDAAIKKADENLLSAVRRLEDAEISYAAAERDYGKNEEKAYDSWQTEITNAQNALESAKKKADDNLLSAARRVEDAEVSLASAERDQSKSASQSADTALQNSISAITLKLDIEDQHKVVDALDMLARNSGVLYTDIAGVVLSAKSEGNMTGKDALVSFMDGAKGFEARLLLDKTDSDKLAVGDDFQVSTGGGSMYYTPTVTGLVSSISSPDDQDKVQVTIELPDADWSEGQRVDVQSTRNRSTYDMCVPLSAVRSDNTGYYLYTVEQENTVLGVANIVIRVPVTIIASDNDNAAIQGPVNRGSQIITGSSKAVVAGDRVRVDG